MANGEPLQTADLDRPHRRRCLWCGVLAREFRDIPPARDHRHHSSRQVPETAAIAMARRVADETLIALFLDMLAAERGAAGNTITAYRHDLDDLSSYLRSAGTELFGADTQALRGFLADLAERGFKATSLGRRLSAGGAVFWVFFPEGKRHAPRGG